VSARRSAVVLACVVLLLGAVAPSVLATGTGGVIGDSGPTLAAGGVEVVSAGNNTTIRHRNPEAGDEPGDLMAVRAHLAGEMGRVIVDCSRAVGVGGFDPCEGLNGSYRDSLSKYAELSRETEGGRDDANVRSFRRARNESRQYARTVRQFRETYETYREARANGDTERARRAARELRTLSERADRTGGNLTRSLGNVTRAGVDVAPASRAVNETTANVTRTVEGIERDLFVGTETTARVNGSAASFLDPLVVTGRVTAANGTAIPNASVGLTRVRGGNATGRVRARTLTNTTGHYRLDYHPVTTPVGSVPFVIRLFPEGESAYLPSNATARTRIEQVPANLTVLEAPGETAYGDRLRVRVLVTAGGDTAERVPVSDLPVVTRIGEFRIGSGRTGSDGTAVPDGRFPAAVRTGERTLVVGFEAADRAIAPATETVGIDVRETETTIDATARMPTEGRITVEGTLTTADGRPLARRPVRATLAGRSLGLLRSDENGSFETNLSVPTEVLPAEGTGERDLRLVYDGSGRNLGSTETALTVTLAAADPGPDLPFDSPLLGLGLAALLLVVIGSAGALLQRRRGVDGNRPVSRRGGVDGREEPTVDVPAALATIRAAMGSGDYDLVTTAGYRTVRRALADQVGARPDATHWEFYGACTTDGVDPERLDAVRRLTERFERVAFAGEEASRSVAAASLADAETVLGDATGGGRGPDDGGEDGTADAGADARGS
jgi:hypothetical protein